MTFMLPLSERSGDHAGGRRPAGADRAGRCTGTGSGAGSTAGWTDDAGYAADHHQHGRDPADSSKNLGEMFIFLSFGPFKKIINW